MNKCYSAFKRELVNCYVVSSAVINKRLMRREIVRRNVFKYFRSQVDYNTKSS